MQALEDKKGSFRPLTENLLPLVMRTLYDMMANGDNKAREKALGHMLKIQGLSIDVTRTEDADTIMRMVEKMRQAIPVEILSMEPRP